MLEYIKSQIRAQNAGSVAPASTPEDVPDDVITEYAQLFQELDDISVEGSEAGKERKLGVDIPLEDDPEVESIEINLDGSRVEDVPGDATVVESYETMKTYDQFFMEAATKVERLPRESDESYEKRVSVLADQMYEEYCVDAEEIGAFGFSKINLTDERVPSKINVDFGPMKKGSDKSFMAKVRTFFATDGEHKITKKQLDSVRLVQNGAFAKIGEPLMAYMESHYDVPAGSSVWDVCTPKNLIVPKGNGDSFCVVLEYTNEITGIHEFYGWTKPVTSGSIENSIIQEGCNKESFNPEAIKADLERSLKEDQEAPTYSGEDAFKELSTFFSKDNANGIEENEIEKYNRAMTKIGDLFSDVDDIRIPKSRCKVQFRGKFNKSMSGYIKISFMNKTKILVQAKAAGEERFEKVAPSKKYKDFEKVIKQLEKWLDGKAKGKVVSESYVDNIDDCVSVNMESFAEDPFFQEYHVPYTKGYPGFNRIKKVPKDAVKIKVNSTDEMRKEMKKYNMFNSKALEEGYLCYGYAKNDIHRKYDLIYFFGKGAEEWINEIGKHAPVGQGSWTYMNKSKHHTNESFVLDCEKFNMESFVNETQYENKDIYIQESVAAAQEERVAKKKPLSRFYQEAIDFGGGDAGSDTTPADDNGGTADAPPPIDNGGGDQSGDQNVDTGNASDATSTDTQQPEGDDADKETAAVNNVSAEIAEKVANTTQADATGNDPNSNNDEMITFDDEDNTGSVDDSMGDLATPDETASVDDQLDDLDNTSSDSEGFDDTDMSDDGGLEVGDIDSMSMEDIMNNASEKLKNMPLGELRAFLNSNPTEDAIQEAFILTNKNINKEVDINLRKCLGILNDNKMDIDKLVKKFKFNGHKLNRVLSKAAKMGKVYSSDEQESIKKLNSYLGELMVSLKKKNDSSYVSSVKRKIEAFIKQSKIVAAFVEDKMNADTVQEGFVQEGLFLSPSNAKKRLASKIAPVHADLASIVRAYDEGKLTKGKLTKMYRPKTVSRTNTFGSDDDVFRTSRTKDLEINTPQMDNLNALVKIANKILRKEKVQSVFSTDELKQISNLVDTLDDFVDFIESVIFDTSDKATLLDMVGKDAKKLVDMLKTLYDSCSETSDSLDDAKSEQETNDDITPSEESDTDVSTEDATVDSDDTNDSDDGEEDDE